MPQKQPEAQQPDPNTEGKIDDRADWAENQLAGLPWIQRFARVTATIGDESIIQHLNELSRDLEAGGASIFAFAAQTPTSAIVCVQGPKEHVDQVLNLVDAEVGE